MTNIGSSDRYTVISADAHAGASVLDYRPYLPARWHEEFDEWAVGAGTEWLPNVAEGADDEADCNWSSARRDRDNEAAGICAELIFPNTVPPFYPRGDSMTAQLPRTREDYERRFAGVQAHNRWTVDFCAQAAGRRRGLVQILLNDIDDALAEIRWGKEAGLAGILIPAVQLNHPTVEGLWSKRYDPIWALADELDLPVNQHAGAGLPQMGNDTAERSAVSFEAKFYVRRSLWNLIYGGAFDRFPRLRLIMTEEGLDWLLPTMRQLEWHVTRNSDDRVVHGKVWGEAARALKLRPMEYFQRNCYITASGEFHHGAMVNRDKEIGLDHVMWGADYPHDEGTHPYTREALRAIFADVPVEDCRMILGLNAAELYGFDLELLRPVAERIGPTLEEVHTPLDRYPDGSTLELFLGKLGEPGSVGAF